MSTSSLAEPFGIPTADLYAPDVATTELVGIETVRTRLADRLRLAKEEQRHTVVTRHSALEGVLVDMEWYREARRALGQPTDL